MSSHTTTESTDATTGDSVDVTTDDSMEATYAFIDTTALDGNVIEEEDPDIPVAESFPNTSERFRYSCSSKGHSTQRKKQAYMAQL